LAFACDWATAPRAFSIARVRPATPGAVGEAEVDGLVGAAGWGAGVVELVALGLE
jgi:hypothetical protein